LVGSRGVALVPAIIARGRARLAIFQWPAGLPYPHWGRSGSFAAL